MIFSRFSFYIFSFIFKFLFYDDRVVCYHSNKVKNYTYISRTRNSEPLTRWEFIVKYNTRISILTIFSRFSFFHIFFILHSNFQVCLLRRSGGFQSCTNGGRFASSPGINCARRGHNSLARRLEPRSDVRLAMGEER